MSILQRMEDFIQRHKTWVVAAPAIGFTAPFMLSDALYQPIANTLMSGLGLNSLEASAAIGLVPMAAGLGTMVAAGSILGANAVRKYLSQSETRDEFEAISSNDRDLSPSFEVVHLNPNLIQRRHLMPNVQAETTLRTTLVAPTHDRESR